MYGQLKLDVLSGDWMYFNRDFYNGKGLGKFRAKQFGCNKRLVALTEDVLSGFHCNSLCGHHRKSLETPGERE